MIEESLLKSGILGKDGFVWWIGRVAKQETWFLQNLGSAFSGEQGFRCKVRIIGYHPFDDKLKEEDLPWAQVLLDATSGNAANGQTMSLEGGETCVGFFLDGEDAQQPVIIGLLHRNANIKESKTDELKRLEGETEFKNLPLYTKNNTNRPSPSVKPGVGAIVETPKNAQYCIWGDVNGPSAAAAKFEKQNTRPSRIPSVCNNDLIGGITRILQDFIAFVNTIEKTIGQFIDPLLNEIVDIANSIKNVAGQIGGLIKQIINSIRSSIIKCVIALFKKFLGIQKKTNPTHPITTPIAQKATKTLLEQIFCIFEKLIDEIIDFVVKILENMIDSAINPSLCAAEQAVSGILAKLMNMIENALEPILSGVSWLTGGLSSVSGILNQVSTLATQIYNFISCDELKCNSPSEWISSTSAALQRGADDWQKQLDNIDVLGGISKDLNQISKAIDAEVIIPNPLQQELNTARSNLDRVVNDDNFILVQGADSQIEVAEAAVQIAENKVKQYGSENTDLNEVSYRGSNLGGLSKVANALGGDLNSIEGAIATLTGFGNENDIFDSCNKKGKNPQTQNDLAPVPLGYKYSYCIPPTAEVFGSGSGAKLIPIVISGSIFSVEIENGGFGYDTPLPIAIIDNSNYGNGAEVQAIVENGVIVEVVIISGGFGYCPGNYSNVGNDDTNGIDDNVSPTIGVSSSVVGILTSIFIQAPGIGYTSGDTIGIGNTNIKPIITPNGSIVKIQVPTNFNQIFSNTPKLIINTNTGVGANLVPVMKYVPQGLYVNKNAKLTISQDKIINVVDCI
jgi:hypothetical protein